MSQLNRIHAHTLKKGIEYSKTLIEELLRIPDIPYAHKLFNQSPYPTVFLYNKLIKAYSSQNQPRQCLSLYSQMLLKDCPPNELTFTFLFPACASFYSLLHGKLIHTHFIKSGFDFDVYALTALVDMYAKLGVLIWARQVFDEMTVRDIPTWNSLIAGYSRSGDMEGALKLFKLMPSRSVVSWTTMISGYSQNGMYTKALQMFLKMEKDEEVWPNEVTIASVFSACAKLGALEVGERIESYGRDNGLMKNLYVSNALLEMYARCGKIDAARHVFNEIGKRRNLCSWNSMLMGLAVHGRSNEALHLYDQMLGEGSEPDDVTFVGLILACTHGGLVAKGWQLFQSMETNFSIVPKLEHYGCMVDLLGRAGELQEAYDLIKSMPMKPDSVIWGTLLGACSFHNNVQFAETAAESLFQLEPWNPGNYVILCNIYASAQRWDGVAKLRKLMKGGQITKAAGYSVIEGEGEIHKFIVEDKSHPRHSEIYALLNEISTKMKLQITEDDFEAELEELFLMEEATLADSFLADLDELSDNDADLVGEDDDVEAGNMDEDVDGDLADIEALNYDDLDSVSKLQKTQRFNDIMQKVENALEKGSDVQDHGMVLEDDPEYQLIVNCNALSVDIENEIIIIHNFIRDKYRLKFPELESLVHHPIDYARVVKKIGNEMDLTLVDMEGLIPAAIRMVISVTASTTSGKPLPEEVLQKTIDACNRALALDSAKKKVLDFVETRMGYIAPNLSAIVGSAVAAKLMGTAGGLTALAKMPACNVQLLGAKKKNLAGFSTATSQFRVGYIEQTEVFQSTPPSLRMRAGRLLAAKSTLAARVDSTRGDPSGNTGRTLREEIHKKIEKWQEPPPAKQPKPLPVPDSEPKKKRGGRRLRKMKERYAITDMRKLANRMQFGVPEESSLGDGLGEGYGMLGQAGNGKLRVSIGQSKLAAKVAKKFKVKNYGSSGATSGLTSSLAFTPVQGIELTNPQAHAHQLGSGTQSTYFSENGTFSKIKRT